MKLVRKPAKLTVSTHEEKVNIHVEEHKLQGVRNRITLDVRTTVNTKKMPTAMYDLGTGSCLSKRFSAGYLEGCEVLVSIHGREKKNTYLLVEL